MDAKTVVKRGGRGKKVQEETAELDVVEPVANGKKKALAKEKAPAKKGRGAKAKAQEPEVEEDEEEVESEELAPPPVKKGGRGKKTAEEKVEDIASQPAKKARGKAAKKDDAEQEFEEPEASEPSLAKRGRGKQKAETKDAEPQEKPVIGKRGRGAAKEKDVVSHKKSKDDEAYESDEKVEVEQPAKKGKGGRGKKAAKPVPEAEEPVEETNNAEEPMEEEEVSEAPKTKGKGRGKKAAAETETEKPAKKGGRSKKVAKPTEEVDDAEETKSDDGPKSFVPFEENINKKRGGSRRKVSTPIPQPEVPQQTNGNDPEKKSRKRGAKEDKADETDGAKQSKVTKKEAKPKMNKDSTDFNAINFELEGKEYNYKISSWNVAGLRAWLGKGCLDYIHKENPDIICLQETKCIDDQLPEEVKHIKGYHPYWLCKPGGHAGVAIYSKKMPINITYGLGDEEQDEQGRLLTAEFEKFYIVNAYVPNSGRGLVTLPKRLRWDEKFQKYLKDLDAKKPVILTGDLNVAHEEIDLANPKSNKKNAGFTQEEREGMTNMLQLGFVDTYRQLYPDQRGSYTYWTYMGNARSKNVGWRLDYFILSERLSGKVIDNVMRTEVMGSDHCPITLFLNI